MSALVNTIPIAVTLFALFAALLPCAAVAGESEPPERETRVTQIIDGQDHTATIYDTGSSGIQVIENGKPTRFYNRADNGLFIDVTAPADEPHQELTTPIHTTHRPLKEEAPEFICGQTTAKK